MQGQSITFDTSVSTFLGLAVRILGIEAVLSSLLLRDVAGRLTLISEGPLDEGLVSQLSEGLLAVMAPYVRPGRVVLSKSTPGIDAVLNGAFIGHVYVNLEVNGTETIAVMRLVDRRVIGRDWQTRPAPGWEPPAPARVVFASLKGGVGRSTALAVLASDLANDGKNVLVIDLDLEAPGIGAMLVSSKTRPRYGVLDWMVEANLQDLDDEFLTQMVAPSDISGGRGVIDVVPAVGSSSDEHPHNVLSKLARAYLEDARAGEDATFLTKVSKLIDALSSRRTYDAILIDARAGLHETTAASVLGLGADVLFFGMNSAQTFESYRFLLCQIKDVLADHDAHNSAQSYRTRLSQDHEVEELPLLSQDFINRLKFVHAKSSKEDVDLTRFRDRLHKLFVDSGFYRADSIERVAEPGEEVSFIIHTEIGVDDEAAPHFAWPIYGSTAYSVFDPFAADDAKSEDQRVVSLNQLDPTMYEEAFGDFLKNIRERIRLPRSSN